MISVRPMPPERWCWLAARAGLVPGPTFHAIEAVEDLQGAEGPERTVGAVAYDGFTPASLSMHVAFDSPIALRALLKTAFGLAFLPPPKGWGKRMVTGTVLGTNHRALALDLHLGFREVGRLKDGWDEGVDLVFMAMRREECRWLDRNPPADAGDHGAGQEAA